MKRNLILVAAALVLLGLAAFFLIVPKVVDGKYNAVFRDPPYAASDKARDLHRRLIVADLHADSLLWDRDLTARNARGHVDLPRLLEGNVALQAFTIVTKVPRGLNIESNDDRSDLITTLAVAGRWPISTWTSLKERAIYQARSLEALAAGSNGKLVLIKTAADLSSYLERRRSDPNVTAAILGVEGAHALEGDLNNVEVFFNAGVRMMSPSHFFDNDIGGSAHGLGKGGLTEKGREMVRRMQAAHMLLDLAHASPAVISDVLAVSAAPLVVSHTGVKGTCDNTRNLTDEQLKGIAATGGVIGIGYWETAVCGRDARSIARAVRYTADLVGVEHVALGSDFDGAVTTPFDATGLVQITDALIEEGFGEEEIKLIMGGNVVRLLTQSLP